LAREAAESLASGGDGRIDCVDTAGRFDAKKHTTGGTHLKLEGNRVAGEMMAAILKQNW
jgi:hypothetical protein